MNNYLCPNCNAKINIEDNFCINCGIRLKNSSVFLGDLKKNIESFFTLCRGLEVVGENNEDYPLIRYIKSTPGSNIPGIFVDDIFKFLCYLGIADGIMHDNETALINYIFNSNWTKDELHQMFNVDLDHHITKSLPMSFMIIHEGDLNFNNTTTSNSEKTEILFKIYNELGRFFISIDGNVAEEELKLFNHYMNNLRINLNDFKINGYQSVLTNLNLNTVHTPDAAMNKNDDGTLEEELDKLNNLIGLELIKADVNSLINLIQVRQVREQKGMKQPPMSLHLVFSGNPGTGKTTVARILSRIYYKLGVLSKGHLIETDRSGLVAGYIGHTALKVQEVVQKAMGGILFIDEAYALSAYKGENDFGQEAIDTLLKAMEDNRDDLIVIVAGYPELMEEFLQSNPGLESRFNKYMYFEDYTADELYNIFKLICDENNYILDDEADEFIKTHFIEVYNNRGENFGNGRYVRNLFEKSIQKQANRIAPILDTASDEEFITLKCEDFK